jgi:hypothetical protein
VDESRPDPSFLDECRISFIGAGALEGNCVSRAVITLSGDMTPAMLYLSRVIAHCGYNPGSKTMAFRWGGMPVVVQPDTITINDMRDMETARRFLDWLKEKLKIAG